MEFNELGINEQILKAIEREKFEHPTKIQEMTIPLIIQGKDIIAGSATGSGKTLAFGAGIIQKTEKGKGIQALILSPTRELAEQVSQEIKKFSEYKHLKVIPIYGGVSINPQIDLLRSADIVVGTPGRILDHIDRNTINLTRVNMLVLDEADRMLDMGFIDDVEKIIRRCPKERQTLLFSATIYPEIAQLARRYMIDPKRISAEAQVDPKKLRQVYYNALDNIKFSLLVHLLNNENSGLVMVFCNTRKNADFVSKNLKINGIAAQAIHGGLTQDKRKKILEGFNTKKAYVLVCTDVAARGLDINGVSHVYNYDIPKDSKEYIHRIGRTARAGKEGIAINILSQRDHDNFSRVERDCDVRIQKEETPNVPRAKIKIEEKRRGGFARKGFGPRPNAHGQKSWHGSDRPGRNQGRSRFSKNKRTPASS